MKRDDRWTGPIDIPDLSIENPGWVRRHIDWTLPYAGERDRMRVALRLARLNIEQKTGGPFGAAVFEAVSGRLVAAGVNRVAAFGNTVLHAEVMAITMAEHHFGGHGLARDDLPAIELYSSCEPCLMCVGAIMMSGVPAVLSASTVEDAAAVGIDGGAAPAAVWDLLRERGVSVTQRVLRDEGKDVLALWRAATGPIRR